MIFGREFRPTLKRGGEMTLGEKIWHIRWTLVLLLAVVASVGFLMLYSAAGGRVDPWASKQMARFAVGVALMIGVALVDIRVWLRHAYTLYGIAFLLLIAVDIFGHIGMGAQRWINLGFIQLQPSEIMKIALVLALARYFHGASIEDIGRPLFLVPPIALVFAPAGLVMRQPDLGTAILLIASGGALFFLAGVRLWKFALVIASGLAALPVGWHFLRDYQKDRILIFLDPDEDPLGAGYHITQSKIALGSGGLFGKGFLQGSQSHLNYLPEKQTDFIFTMLSEEFGMVGGLVLLGLYVLLLVYAYAIAMSCRSHFGRLLALGIASIFFLYVFINIGMVMGLLPVVGVPLPLISYGGTAMLSLLFGFGLIMGVSVHRDLYFGRRGGVDD